MKRKLTQKQIEANRVRAQKSTGPKTLEGKARSSQNALKHGMYAIAAFYPDENDELRAELTRQFYEDFAPANINERMLIEQMILVQWRLLRLASAHPPMAPDWDTALRQGTALEKLYSSLYRNYAKAAEQLERSRKLRGALPPDNPREDITPIPTNGARKPKPIPFTPQNFDDAGFVSEKLAVPPASCLLPPTSSLPTESRR